MEDNKQGAGASSAAQLGQTNAAATDPANKSA
jgi:hypothetical protein